LPWGKNLQNLPFENLGYATDLDFIQELGVAFDSKLKFDLHINEKVNKFYSVLGKINRHFK
jgi:hypothetical protein